MRVEAYSAVNRIYQSGAASSAKKGGSTASYSDKLEISRTAKDYSDSKRGSKPDIGSKRRQGCTDKSGNGGRNISCECTGSCR